MIWRPPRSPLFPTRRSSDLALADAGVAIVVATGRAMPGTMEVVDRIGLQDGTAVTSNGAIVISYHPVEVLHSVTFDRSEEHTSELQSRLHLVCRLLLEKKKH